MVSRVRPIIRATCEHKNASRWVICNLPQNLFIFRSSFHCCAMLFFGIIFCQEGKSYKIIIGVTFVYRLLHESLWYACDQQKVNLLLEANKWKNKINNDLQVAHPHSGSSSPWFLVELEFGNVGFWGEGKTGVPGEKPLGTRERTNNKLNPHMASTPGFEPGPPWWEASALTTTPPLLPKGHHIQTRKLKHATLPVGRC